MLIESYSSAGEKNDCLSSGRTLLVCISTLPFQFGPHETVDDFDAKATQQV
jgi:L-ascorbate peroxidase